MLRVSRKNNSNEDDTNLSLLPIMSLLVILIPLLIGNVAFFHLRSIEVNSPSVSTNEPVIPSGETNKDRQVVIQLSVSVQKYSFELIDEDTGEPISKLEIPTDGGKEIKTISQKLFNVKKTYPKLDTILVSVEKNVKYKTLVTILDKCKTPNGTQVEPFKLVIIPLGGV